MPTVKKTFCSICSAFCGFEAHVEDGRVVDMVPDREHPMSRGFSCTKGRQFHHLLSAANRETHAAERVGEELERRSPAAVLDAVAERLDHIREVHGPSSIAVYAGNGVTFKTTVLPAIHGWLRGLGSHHLYSSLTIDQPAKIISAGRVGVWAGGGHDFESSDVAMMLGNNVVVSSLNVPGAPPGWRPRAIREAKERGLKLIVVDPRRTQTAALADLHLQIRPGEDATLLAAMINRILNESAHDAIFCDEFVDGIADLREALRPFTLDYAAQRTGLTTADIALATDMFTSAKRGTVTSATGPDMGPHGNLVEHLIASVNILCGRLNRAGEIAESIAMLMPDLPPIAAVVPRDFLPDTLAAEKNLHRSRLHGAHQVFNEMPTSTLADEILAPGDGQIRALIVIGGNPITSWPDYDKTRRALESLDLLVCIDVRRTDTAMLAHYFLPGSYGLERGEMTSFNDYVYNAPFVHYADGVVEPPGDAREEWIYLAELAKRLGTTIELPGGQLDLANLPTTREYFTLLYPDGSTRVPLAELMAQNGGKVFEQFARVEVLPKFEGMDDRLQLFPVGVADEIANLVAYHASADESRSRPDQFTHLLTCRRNGQVYNSMCHELPRTATGNPAFLHPDDIEALGASSGQVMRLMSAHGAIDVELAADATMLSGVVSITHGFGNRSTGEGGADFPAVSRLIGTGTTLDSIARMPITSALPVRFERIGAMHHTTSTGA